MATSSDSDDPPYIRISTRTGLSRLRHMDFRHEAAELRRDLLRVTCLWWHHPDAVLRGIALAVVRSFKPTPRNSHALWLSFIALTLFLLISYAGQVLRDWAAVDAIIWPATAAWLFLFGRVFEIEFSVALPGIELTNADDDNADD